MLDACLPFLPKLDADDQDEDDEPTEQQSQFLLIQKAEETMEETGIEGQQENLVLCSLVTVVWSFRCKQKLRIV